MNPARFILAAALLAVFPRGAAAAECSALHDALESPAGVQAAGGVTTGTVTFVPAVNGNGILLDGAADVTYAAGAFQGPAGSVSVWVRKASADPDGGLLQIGELGQSNSLGIFYINGTDLLFEIRHADWELQQVTIPGALSQGAWTHVVATWKYDGAGTFISLTTNGYTGTSTYSMGPFDPTTAAAQIGYTGFYGHGECILDELRFFDYALLRSEAYAEYVYSSNRHHAQPGAKPVSTGAVQVVGKSLLVNGQPFTVKGVGYAPTPNGYWPWEAPPVFDDPDIVARDLKLLQNMNVNVIRTWAQLPDATLLDALYYDAAEPIRVIMGYWVPIDGQDYGDPATIAAHESAFASLINQFKDHPGLLAWGIGNEPNIWHQGDSLRNWYALANRLAEVAYEQEGPGYHPTIIINGDMMDMGNVDVGSDDLSLDHIDMWGHNTYFGWDAQCYFDYYDRLSAKPLIFSEYGIDAWNNQAGEVYEDVQARWVVQQWRQISSACVGASLMAYSDEWWKAGDPLHQDFGGYATGAHPDGFSNEEWWGALWAQDNGDGPDILHPRQVYYDLAREFLDCEDFESCADIDRDGVRDDACTWYRCTAGECQGSAVVFADVGGAFGACEPDGTVDGNDRFHILNCFANTDTNGSAGYPCESAPPQAFNVDTAGLNAACSPDGYCDANDVFAVLNAFSGESTCACPLNDEPGPAPNPPP